MDSEGSVETPQGAPLLVGPQDLLLSLLRVFPRRGIFPALPFAGLAQVLLFPVWSKAIFYQLFTSAVAALDRDRYRHKLAGPFYILL